MADPLTIFAAVSKALQFVHLGIGLVTTTIEYSQGGGCNQYQALKGLVQLLIVSNAYLQGVDDIQCCPWAAPDPARALYSVKLECLRVGNDFIRLVDTSG